MSNETGERLAAVTYLPGVERGRPVVGLANAQSAAPAAVTPSKGGGSRSGARVSRLVPEGVETGVERDERIDRLVVARLRRSSLSVSEVRSVLGEHGLASEEIDEWIERYERLGYLSDARLAEQVVHRSGSRRGYGSGAVLSELRRRGIDREVASEAVVGLDRDAERANAAEVAERRARQLMGLDRATAERRLNAFLMRRGYASDVIREAVASALPR